jgi:hypothetical protein
MKVNALFKRTSPSGTRRLELRLGRLSRTAHGDGFRDRVDPAAVPHGGGAELRDIESRQEMRRRSSRG